MKYNVGDKVLVVKAQEGIDEMQELVGTVATVFFVGAGYYELKECKIAYSWSEEWLEEWFEDIPYEINASDWSLILGETLCSKEKKRMLE